MMKHNTINTALLHYSPNIMELIILQEQKLKFTFVNLKKNFRKPLVYALKLNEFSLMVVANNI
jgi:hypothetical protein